jgi:hypothetical protein
MSKPKVTKEGIGAATAYRPTKRTKNPPSRKGNKRRKQSGR